MTVLLQEWKAVVMAQESHFEQQLQYKLSLPRNISSQSGSSSVGAVGGADGVTGTFKKLNVD